jgi:lipoyl(octanoyl) transferase
MSRRLEIRALGRISFADGLALQEQIVQQKYLDGRAPDQLLLLEHEAVYTIGRTPDQSSLRGVKHLPHPIFETNRGGQATYHGPGQLVAYFLLDLRRYGQDLHRYLRWIERLLIELLAKYEAPASTRPGLTGVWVGSKKIASIGIGIRHWITMHGLALNVGGDLSPFDHITPCGIADVTMTSIERETGKFFQINEVGESLGELATERLPGLTAPPAIAPLHQNHNSTPIPSAF